MNKNKGQEICPLAVPPLTFPLQSEVITFLPYRALREACTPTFMSPPALAHVSDPGCMCLNAHCSLELAPVRQLQLNFRKSITKMSLSVPHIHGFLGFSPQVKLWQYR